MVLTIAIDNWSFVPVTHFTLVQSNPRFWKAAKQLGRPMPCTSVTGRVESLESWKVWKVLAPWKALLLPAGKGLLTSTSIIMMDY